MRKTQAALTLLIAFNAAAAARSAIAVDGVVEINQAKVLKGGGHFPFVIGVPGSYRLTSNLDVTNDPGNATLPQNRSAISVTADNVTIDLNGFTISGPTTCTVGVNGWVTGCAPTGTGSGISLAGVNDVTVMGGVIRGMGGYGLRGTAWSVQVDDVTARGNGTTGFALYDHASVHRCAARENGAWGIYVSSDDFLVEATRIEGNGSAGLRGRDGARIANNVISINGGSGIEIRSGVVTGNTINKNSSYGVLHFDVANQAGGLFVQGNSVLLNVAYGLSLGGGDGFVANVVDGNNGGNANAQTSGGISMGTNICRATTTCP